MADFDLSALAFNFAYPTNRLLTDDVGMPGAYVRLAAQNLSALLTNGDSTVHPAFRIGSEEKSEILIGKYQGSVHNNRVYSLPGVDPKTNITLDNYVAYCRNKGEGHHCITAAEFAFLALWCKKNKCQPYGNNNYGKDTRETEYLAIPTCYDGEKIGRCATGTGPLTWSHNKQHDGIWDLNGNIWEWIAGIRLVYGELQVIPYNDAALADTDMSATSAAWKALNAAATSYSDLFITPDGSGTTSGSVKLDYSTDHWQWDTTISDSSDTGRGASFQKTTCAAGISDFTKLYLQAMALTPEDDDTDYENDYFWANNGAAERSASRGGSWHNGTSAGGFNLSFSSSRSNSGASIGGRPAYYK